MEQTRPRAIQNVRSPPPTPPIFLSLSHILSSSAYHPSVHVYEYQSQSFNAEGLFTWAPSIVVKNSSS